MRITYNSPVILTYTLLCTVVFIIDLFLLPNLTATCCTIYPNPNFANPLDILRMASHVVGHVSIGHLAGNFMMILLIGPILEEKYGSMTLLQMILITAIATGFLNITLFQSGLLGASGVVFMLILLASLTNFRSGELPLTFILVVVLYLGAEVLSATQANSVSEFAHIMGGLCGSLFGYIMVDGRKRG